MRALRATSFFAVCACLLCAGALGVVSVFVPSTARAFTEPRTYYDAPQNGGGGGRFFTGSPAEGYGCSACHTGPAKTWPLEISGLPENGYVPGASYALRLRFDEFAAHAESLRADGEQASMGLVAELVSETGEGAGKLDLSPAMDADGRELCVVPKGQHASQLYTVRPGETTREQALHCEAESLGQRCIVSTRGCGASELRVTWTAPTQWQGPIWFAAGFVTTERVSGDPREDAVTEIKRVLLPAATMQRYSESALKAGCSVGGVRARPTESYLGWLMLACALLLVRGAARARRIACALATCAVFLGCRETPDPQFAAGESAGYPKAGLFTPGSTLGMLPPPVVVAGQDAGEGDDGRAEIEDAINEASGENRCVELAGDEGASGMLTISFGTATYGGFYEPENCGAVWIEDADRKYVATPEIWAGLRTRNIFIWGARRCAADSPDVIASATLSDHEMPHEVIWDGKDRQGRVVPNGQYVLNIEVTEDEFDYGRRTEVPFEWGAQAFTLQPEADVLGESVHDLTMVFTPAQ